MHLSLKWRLPEHIWGRTKDRRGCNIVGMKPFVYLLYGVRSRHVSLGPRRVMSNQLPLDWLPTVSWRLLVACCFAMPAQEKDHRSNSPFPQKKQHKIDISRTTSSWLHSGALMASRLISRFNYSVLFAAQTHQNPDPRNPSIGTCPFGSFKHYRVLQVPACHRSAVAGILLHSCPLEDTLQ